MDSSVSPKDEIWFLRVCHQISTGLYQPQCRSYVRPAGNTRDQTDRCTNKIVLKWNYNRCGLHMCSMLFHTRHVSSNLQKSTLRYNKIMVWFWRESPQWARGSSFLRFLDHTQWRTTVDRTPLDEWSAGRRDLYLTTHNTTDRHPCPRWDSNPQSQQTSGRRPTS